MGIKIQDLAFLIGFFSLLALIKSWRWFIASGLVCLLLSFFAFKFWLLFTAERLTWYGAAFILTGLLRVMVSWRKG